VLNYCVAGRTDPASPTIALSLQPLQVAGGGPPASISRSGVVGTVAGAAAQENASGHFLFNLQTLTIPGTANPISGSEVAINTARLEVRWNDGAVFCARLSGTVVKPVTQTLDPAKNICQFVPVVDGTPTPIFEAADFTETACP